MKPLKLGFSLQGINELDEAKGVLTSDLWLNMQWNDPSLKWDRSEYGNIRDIR